MYGDSAQEAAKNIKHSDEARGAYYGAISGAQWGRAQNYDLCIDSSIGVENTVKCIMEFISCKA